MKKGVSTIDRQWFPRKRLTAVWVQWVTNFIQNFEVSGGHLSFNGVTARLTCFGAYGGPYDFDYSVSGTDAVITTGQVYAYGHATVDVPQNKEDTTLATTGGEGSVVNHVFVRGLKLAGGGISTDAEIVISTTAPSVTAADYWELPLYEFTNTAGVVTCTAVHLGRRAIVLPSLL